MFDFLVKSTIRQKIIRLILFNPAKEFYLTEIARTARTTPGTAQRELRKLQKIDLVRFKKKGNLSIFSLNSRHYLLDEIMSIMKKTFGIEEEIKSQLRKIPNVAYAFLFGSYVKDGLKSDSDIDLFIIGDVDENTILEAVSPIETSISREISCRVSSVEEFVRRMRESSFIQDILRNYFLIIGDEHEFKAIAG